MLVTRVVAPIAKGRTFWSEDLLKLCYLYVLLNDGVGITNIGNIKYWDSLHEIVRYKTSKSFQKRFRSKFFDRADIPSDVLEVWVRAGWGFDMFVFCVLLVTRVKWLNGNSVKRNGKEGKGNQIVGNKGECVLLLFLSVLLFSLLAGQPSL